VLLPRPVLLHCDLCLYRFHLLPIFVLLCSSYHRHLHSFPTRRSSDLRRPRPRPPWWAWRAASSPRPATGGTCTTCPSAGPSCSGDRKSTRLNSSHVSISYAVFCLRKKSSVCTC